MCPPFRNSHRKRKCKIMSPIFFKIKVFCRLCIFTLISVIGLAYSTVHICLLPVGELAVDVLKISKKNEWNVSLKEKHDDFSQLDYSTTHCATQHNIIFCNFSSELTANWCFEWWIIVVGSAQKNKLLFSHSSLASVRRPCTLIAI